MSTTLAAFIAALITSGMTSFVSHDLTLVGGSIMAVVFAATAVVQRNVSVYPAFLLGTILMTVIALVSSESNASPFSSTIHVLSMYVAIIGLAFSSPDLSGFCQQVMMATNLILTGWILHQGYGAELLKVWQISTPTGAANVMASQINMTLPLILARIHKSTGREKIAYVALICCNCMAVFLVMSRNGIAAMMIILTLYVLFNHKRLAFVVIMTIISIGVSLDSILQLPYVHHLLVRFRFVGYVATAPRSVIWRVAWDHIRTHPILGVGPGGPKKALAVIDINHAHNTFVQVALETGIPSAAVLGVLILLLLRLPLQTLMTRRECFVMTLPILAYTIYSWTAMPLTYSGMTLLLAACVHEARIAIQQQGRMVALPRRSRQLIPEKRPRLVA